MSRKIQIKEEETKVKVVVPRKIRRDGFPDGFIKKFEKYIANVEIALDESLVDTPPTTSDNDKSKDKSKVKSTDKLENLRLSIEKLRIAFNKDVYLSKEEIKEKKTERKVESSVRKSIDGKHDFNLEIKEFLDILHTNRARSTSYEDMMKNKAHKLPTNGDLVPSKHSQYTKWAGFVTRALSEIPLKAKESDFDSKKWRDSGLKVMFSDRFACAGSLPNASANCSTCGIIDLSRSSVVLGNLECDHLISRLYLKKIYKVLCENEFAGSKTKRKLLGQFIIHCFLSLVPNKEMGWPSNIYYRCVVCNPATEAHLGGATHPSLFSHKKYE